jgi:hypothetical protein
LISRLSLRDDRAIGLSLASSARRCVLMSWRGRGWTSQVWRCRGGEGVLSLAPRNCLDPGMWSMPLSRPGILSLFFRERPPAQLLSGSVSAEDRASCRTPIHSFCGSPSHSASYLQSVRAKTRKIGRSIEKAKENQLLCCFFIQNLNFK